MREGIRAGASGMARSALEPPKKVKGDRFGLLSNKMQERELELERLKTSPKKGPAPALQRYNQISDLNCS